MKNLKKIMQLIFLILCLGHCVTNEQKPVTPPPANQESLSPKPINISTTQKKYVNYFAGLRKSIEHVWVYPKEAIDQKIQGSVDVVFSLHREGSIDKIEIKKSSGSKILDDSIVKTLKLVSPYKPLPKTFAQEIVVAGSFHYIIGDFKNPSDDESQFSEKESRPMENRIFLYPQKH